MINIIQNNVTYQDMIQTAAQSLYDLVKNDSLPQGIYKKASVTVTVGQGVEYGKTQTRAVDQYAKEYGFESAEKTYELVEEEVRTENYVAPSKDKIVEDIKNFISGINLPIEGIPTHEGLVAFFFALNFFVEKAIMQKKIMLL